MLVSMLSVSVQPLDNSSADHALAMGPPCGDSNTED